MQLSRDELNTLASRTLDCAFRVHSQLGPGLLESVYKACLGIELEKAGIPYQVEVPVPVVYDGRLVADIGFRIDLLVADELVLEIKAVEALHPVHQAQLLSYLQLTDKRLGLLLNFNSVQLKDGIKRLVNRF